MFETPTKQPVYTTQPYQCEWHQLAALVDFARLHHLEADISAKDSWHFPGHTLLITLSAPRIRRFAYRPPPPGDLQKETP